jgi:hypothetical protein
MAGRGQVSWLPGIGRPHLPGGSVLPPVADANAPAASFTPVTVAGPRRHLTGLPLTTGRMYKGESIRQTGPRANGYATTFPAAGLSSAMMQTMTCTTSILLMCFGVGFVAPALIPNTKSDDIIMLAIQIPALVVLGIWAWLQFRRLASQEEPNNFRPLSTILILGLIAAVSSFALAAITGTGEQGAQVFMLPLGVVLVLYAFWPEVKATRQASRLGDNTQHRSDHGAN